MNRRGFFAFLASLPLFSFLKPEPKSHGHIIGCSWEGGGADIRADLESLNQRVLDECGYRAERLFMPQPDQEWLEAADG